MDKTHKGVRTWVEVDRKSLAHNYNQFRKIIKPECKLLAVCKSNAYGHGLVQFASEMMNLGVDFLGVDSIVEARTLRQNGIKPPILVLGYVLPELYNEASKLDISITISSIDTLRQIPRFLNSECKLRIHIKIDTGMHRQGFLPEEIEEAIGIIQSMKNIEIEGVFTHLAAAKNPAFPARTQSQLDKFDQACELFEKKQFKFIKHAAATAGTMVFPRSHFDMVRIGIGLYGLWPSVEVESCFKGQMELKPALSWKAVISEIKSIPAGESIGYDFTENFTHETKAAVIPIGYWHGFRRNLSSVGQVLVKGERAKVVGRVSMDMISVDVTKILEVRVGDEVTLIGQDGRKEISAKEVATLSDTSWYETTTCINPLIERVYL